jgi:hypothetical protein
MRCKSPGTRLSSGKDFDGVLTPIDSPTAAEWYLGCLIAILGAVASGIEHPEPGVRSLTDF